MNSKFYNVMDGGRFDAARLKLCLFDAQTVRDIVDLVQYRGMAVVDDTQNRTTDADPPHIWAVCGPDYIKYSDMAPVIVGLATIMLAGLRKPKMGNDEYTEVLKQAFGLPELLARYYGNQIESYDKIIKDANQDASVAFTEQLSYYSNALQEGARRVVNGLANSLGLGTLLNWDQNQTYDLDFLDEMASLGEIVSKMNRRQRLMAAQALIAVQMNTFQTGDPEDGDPADKIEEMVGDVFATIATRRLPPSIFGNYKTAALNSQANAMNVATNLVNEAGISVNPATKKMVSGKPRSAAGVVIRKALDGIMKSNPLKTTLVGALGGFVAGGGAKRLWNAIRKKKKGDPETGDALDSMYGDIASEYGEPYADAWARGDISRIVGEALGDIDGDPELGDLDPASVGAAMGDIEEGDIALAGDLTPEMGGLLMRWRTNRKLKQAARRNARAARKSAKFNSRLQRKQALTNAKIAAKQAGYMNVSAPDPIDPISSDVSSNSGVDAGYLTDAVDANAPVNALDNVDPNGIDPAIFGDEFIP